VNVIFVTRLILWLLWAWNPGKM